MAPDQVSLHVNRSVERLLVQVHLHAVEHSVPWPAATLLAPRRLRRGNNLGYLRPLRTCHANSTAGYLWEGLVLRSLITVSIGTISTFTAIAAPACQIVTGRGLLEEHLLLIMELRDSMPLHSLFLEALLARLAVDVGQQVQRIDVGLHDRVILCQRLLVHVARGAHHVYLLLPLRLDQ